MTLEIGTKVKVLERGFSADAWGLTEEQRKGTVVGHKTSDHGEDFTLNIVTLDDGMSRYDMDLAHGPVGGGVWAYGVDATITPKGARGWLLYDDEVEVLEG
jgi:hypothetical protein